MLMRHENHGWHNAVGSEIEEMKKNGWIESSYEEHAKFVAAKYTVNEVKKEIPAVIQAIPVRGKPGRKPKNPH